MRTAHPTSELASMPTAAMIQLLVHQPFAMGDGRVLGLVQVIHEGVIHRQGLAFAGVAVGIGNLATASPGCRQAGVFHDTGVDGVVTVGAGKRAHEATSWIKAPLSVSTLHRGSSWEPVAAPRG
ncbi:conserved hypothetical protein [Pseudomonas sp. 8O]|nr:conserved hypothetical protein [Pseudomonas sp. 8O]